MNRKLEWPYNGMLARSCRIGSPACRKMHRSKLQQRPGRGQADQQKTRALRPAFPNQICQCGSARSARTCTRATTTAAGTTTVATGAGTEHRLRLHRQQAFALQLLAGQLARASHSLGLFTGLLLGGLFVMPAELHLAENPLALHLLLQRLEGLIDVVIADENLHAASSFSGRIGFG